MDYLTTNSDTRKRGKNFKWTKAHEGKIKELLPRMTLMQIAGEIGVSKDRLTNWMSGHGIRQGDYGGMLKIKVCPNCDEEFKPKTNNRQIYCTRSCRSQAPRAKRTT